MPRQSIELPAVLAEQIRREALAAHPGECCGLIEGQRDGDVFRAAALHAARNLAQAAHRFEIDPKDHLAASKVARANGRELIGCYHSHPAGRAQPSAHDLAGAGEEDFLWLIAAGEELAAFVYFGGGFVGVDCRISSG